MSRDGNDALYAARAVFFGRPLKITTERLFAQLKTAGYSQRDLSDAHRVFDSARIGDAIEKLDKAAPGREKFAATLRLARAVRSHLTDMEPGWLRFLFTLGRSTSDTAFHLSYVRRPKSRAAQPKYAIDRTADTRRHIHDMLVAGSILSRIEAAEKSGDAALISEAIGRAINDDEIKTDEGAALKAWHRFRKLCADETGQRNTYRLEQYAGSIAAYRGRWVALPASGDELARLPSPNGGRPRKT